MAAEGGSMSLYTLHSRPEDIREPVMVMALEGWIDAGFGAASAVAALVAAIDPEPVASFDVDSLLDHRARRPVVRISEGVNVGLTWPEIELRGGHDPNGVSLLVLAGPEPDHQWRAFTDAVAELAAEFGVRLVVGLGAFPAPVPHTRPCRLAATATTLELAQQVGFVPGTLEVPAGVQAALERRFAEVGLPTVGLWARVPHYVAAMPYPAATAALLDGLASLGGLALDTVDLHKAAAETSEKVDALIAANAEHVQLVRQLESQVDAELAQTGGFTNLPSGDEIAAELERYLRGQR
jgi:hypothetical protein